MEYRLSERDSLSTSLVGQQVTFDRPDELLPYLRGGESIESLTLVPTACERAARLGGSL